MDADDPGGGGRQPEPPDRGRPTGSEVGGPAIVAIQTLALSMERTITHLATVVLELNRPAISGESAMCSEAASALH